ncbi:nucleotidyltransferase family protein [Streptomyces xanthii]|uniref:Nucleotidyltransferase family protein n=1 Tax=Streptomyces xanthii TaxID=2768069 RepID=A0A7H1B2A8_9ACTN|nr:nucleotidyltransferase family protein [Streptomyces xanthii]QNS02863.1 nucleotidyltransferase family protein [Streptomyces xanthii]
MTPNAEGVTPHLSDAVTALRPVTPVGPPAELPPDLNQAILEAAKQVASVLKKQGHDFALAGSVAVFAHGGAGNLQHDVDFCIRPEDAEAVAATLENAGLAVHVPPEDWLIKAKCLGQDVDLIFELAHEPVTPELLARATELPLDSVRMPVLAPTDLLCALLSAFSEHYCDFGAVLPMARQLREKIDWQRVDRECGDAPMPDAFLYLLERLQIITPRIRALDEEEQSAPGRHP